MSILIKDDRNFALSNSYFSYILSVNEKGLLQQMYYGPPLSSPWDLVDYHLPVDRAVSSYYEGNSDMNLNEIMLEYPTHGRSDYKHPAFQGVNAEGNTVFTFLYQSHSILSDKPQLDGLPAADGAGSETLVIILKDVKWNLELQLKYTVYEDYGVLAKSARYVNKGEQPIHLGGVASTAIGLPANDYELLHLHGTWSRELNEERTKISKTRMVVESTRGTSSAAHSPFVAVMEPGTNEDNGHVYSTTLVYSGNFAISVEKGEFGDVRLLAGINSFDFRWTLKSGQHFDTPEALHVFSMNGLGNMSHQWHQFVRDRISPARFRNVQRPSFLNTWEACYFDVSTEKVLALADHAKEIGLDMVVLDDGWFTGRNDDTSSLGDWDADENKFPEGIPYLASQIKSKGLKFGIWFEPEMVNPQSQLYRDHPEWILQVPGRKSSLGRNQLTLDLSQVAVTDYIFGKLDKILNCGDIDFVKWDMNRPMTEVGSSHLPATQQGEVAHRYMLGLYTLLDRLTKRYPKILFENCASGGNRFDLGMLSYFPQTWTSDMCDPIGRLDIIHGASYLFPNDVLASYIGPSPNHQNGRVSSIQSRYLAGVFCASRGISLNVPQLEQGEIDTLKQYTAYTRATASEMLGGTFHRLLKDQQKVVWQYTTADETKTYVLYFHILAAPNLPVNRVRLKGINAKAKYELKAEGITYSGDTLMHAGLELPTMSHYPKGKARRMDLGDFNAVLFELNKL